MTSDNLFYNKIIKPNDKGLRKQMTEAKESSIEKFFDNK
jgi:hypothetical protein